MPHNRRVISVHEIEEERKLEDSYDYWSLIKRFYWEYLYPVRAAFAGLQLMHIAGAILTLIPPLILRSIIDDALPASDFPRVMTLAFWALATYFLYALINGNKSYWGHLHAQFVVRDMRNDLYRQYQRLSLGFHDHKKTGELMSRVIDDLNKNQEFIHHGPEALVGSLTQLVGTILILLSLSVPLTLVALTFVPLLVGFAWYLLKKMHLAFRETRRRKAIMNDRLEDNLAGITVIKAFASEDFEDRRFSRTNEAHVAARRRALKYMSILFSGSHFLNAFGIILVMSYGSYLAINGGMSVGTIVAFYGYLLQFRAPLLQLVRTTEGLSEFFAAMERFYNHVDLRPSIVTSPKAVRRNTIKGEVSFEDVYFSYGDEDILKGISFYVPPKKTVALVGPSGAGKTTIVRLIPRLYEVKGGQILIDGVDVRNLDLHDLRNSIAMVMQDDYLFSDSIADNIRYGRPDATDEEIVEAAKAANAHDFIMHMPSGYDTTVGQRGLRLSGGQRQRVSIARAFLKDPKILILDEATSSVDSETEKMIQEAVDRITAGRTTFVIAHRLSTIVGADQILFIDDGRVLERGNHQELMDLGGQYREFYDLQFQEDEAI